MKNLKKISRNISAKFCYGLEFDDHFEEIENNEITKNNEKIVNPSKQKDLRDFLSKENKDDDLKEVEKIIQELNNEEIKVKTNLEDTALVNNKDASNDLSSEIPNAPDSLFRKFFAKDSDLKSAMQNADDLIDSLNNRPGIVPSNFNVEDL